MTTNKGKEGFWRDWVAKAPEERSEQEQSFDSPYGAVGVLPHHAARSRCPNPHPVSPRYGITNIEDSLERTQPRQAAAGSTLWGRLQRTDESAQAQKVIRPMRRGPLPPHNTPSGGVYVEGEYVQRREEGDADVPGRLELFPNRLGQHFEGWMQEQRDAEEQAAQGFAPRRGQMSFDRRMCQEEQSLTGPVGGLMAVPNSKEAAASPRNYGMRPTDVTEMVAAKAVPDGSYPATGGRSPDGRAFGWGGREVKCLDVRHEGQLLDRQHVYKPYEPHLQLGEYGFGRSRNIGSEIFPESFNNTSPRLREVALMHQTADAGGFRRIESDVQFPTNVVPRGDIPYHDHRAVSTDLHMKTWSRGYELQTDAMPSPRPQINNGRRLTGIHHPSARKPSQNIPDYVKDALENWR